MLRLLTTKRWLIWLLVATVWAVLCLFAGRWQWHRWQDKSATQDRIERNYDAEPVPIASALKNGSVPDKAVEWKQVSGVGRYTGDTLMVRNRPGPGGDFGYQAVDVFTTGGVSVLVDRGWVGNGPNARTPSSVPRPPGGEVTLTGWIRPSERSLARPEVSGQLSSLSVADAEAATGRDLVGGYVRMRSERAADGSTPPRPQALDKPSQGMAAGINLSYALQWWLGIVAGYGFVLLRARREHLDSLEAARTPSTAPPVEPGGDDAASARVERPKREKKRKHRIWDDEDE